MRKLLSSALLGVVALSMSACASDGGAGGKVSGAKKAVAKFAANRINGYCDKVVENYGDYRDEALARINAALREEGARGTIEGVKCDNRTE